MSWRRCRAMRPGEIDGTDYMFVSKAEFESWIKEDKLLEHALVYGEYKGILRSQITHALAHDQDVILRLDVQGAATMRRLMPDSVSIFLVRFLYAWSCLRAQTSFCLQVLATPWTTHIILQPLNVLMLDLVVQYCYALPEVVISQSVCSLCPMPCILSYSWYALWWHYLILAKATVDVCHWTACCMLFIVRLVNASSAQQAVPVISLFVSAGQTVKHLHLPPSCRRDNGMHDYCDFLSL